MIDTKGRSLCEVFFLAKVFQTKSARVTKVYTFQIFLHAQKSGKSMEYWDAFSMLRTALKKKKRGILGRFLQTSLNSEISLEYWDAISKLPKKWKITPISPSLTSLFHALFQTLNY